MAEDDLPTKQPAIEERRDKRGKYRLHLSVPKPLSRVNLGMPWYEKLRGTTFDSKVAKFGYKGISLQTDSYFFADVEKHSYFNTKKSFQLQAGKEWLQYASASQWTATMQDATYASDARMTLVAGAGQGQRQPPDHGMEVRTDPYNNLYLHYRVDTVMMGLSEFMTGRREREDPWGLSVFQPFGGREFNSKKPHIKPEEGFWDVLKRAAELLGYGLPDFEGLHKHFPKPDSNREKYGYGKPYFTTFDPYEMKKTDGEEGTVQVFLTLKNVSTLMRRFADVTAKIADAIYNLPLVRQAAKLMEAVDKFNSSIDASQRIANTFGAGKPSNDDKVMFGEEAPFDKQMLDVFYPVVDTWCGATKPKEEDKAEIELVAPKNPDKKSESDGLPPYVWAKVPAGIYGYVKVVPDPDPLPSPDLDKLHTAKVPGKTPEVKAKKPVKAISNPPSTTVTITAVPPEIPFTVTLPTPVDSPEAAADLLNAPFAAADMGSPFEVVQSAYGTALRFDPEAIALFESLTFTGVGVDGLGLDETLTAATTGGAVDLAKLAGAMIQIEITRNAETSFTVAWTAQDTASVGTLAGAFSREAKKKKIPLSAKVDGNKVELKLAGGFLIGLSGALDLLAFATSSGNPVKSEDITVLHWGAAKWITVTTEKKGLFLALTSALVPAAGNVGPLVAAIDAELGEGASDAGGGVLKVKSTGYGSDAFVEVRADSVVTLVDYLGFETPTGGSVVRQQGVDVSLTPSQLAEVLRGSLGDAVGSPSSYPRYDPGAFEVKADDAKGTVKLVAQKPLSDHEKYLYYIKTAGKLFDALGASSKDYVPKPSWHEDLDAFQKMLSGLNSLPDDLANVVRPITHLVQDVVTLYNDATKGLTAVVEALAGSRFVPDGPPSALGMFAKDGITLGTPDRIVSAAGKGFVFFADGGTGQRDTEKFVLAEYERFITNLAANEIKGFGDLIIGPKTDTDPEKEKSGSGGFTLFSNSTTSLVTRSSLDLLAIGSKKSKTGELLGRGVARLAATRSVEVAGHSRVTIAATASKDEDVAVKHKRVAEKYDTTKLELGEVGGGEVEVLGEQIRLGAPLVHRAHMALADEIPWPWAREAKGTPALKEKGLKLPMTERAYAPPTQQVTLGAVELIEATSTPFLLQVKHDGVYLGSPGGHEAKKFEDRQKKEKKAIEYHFKEQKEYWGLVKKQAKKAAESAKKNMKTLEKAPPGDKIEGMRALDWEKLGKYYEKVESNATQYYEKVEKTQKKAEQDLEKKYDALGDQGPALVMEKDRIVLGFQMKSGKWGPHLEIKMDGITLNMKTPDDKKRASLKLEGQKITLSPADGDVKMAMESSQAKIEGGSSSYIQWSASSVDGNRIKKI